MSFGILKLPNWTKPKLYPKSVLIFYTGHNSLTVILLVFQKKCKIDAICSAIAHTLGMPNGVKFNFTSKHHRTEPNTGSPTCAPMWAEGCIWSCSPLLLGVRGREGWQLCGEVRPPDKGLWNQTWWLSGDSDTRTHTHTHAHLPLPDVGLPLLCCLLLFLSFLLSLHSPHAFCFVYSFCILLMWHTILISAVGA